MEDSNSRLLALPVELRLKIYSYIQPQHYGNYYRLREVVLITAPRMSESTAIALAQTNRQIYGEMIDFYTNHKLYDVFIRDPDDFKCSDFGSRLANLRILSKAKHVRIRACFPTQQDITSLLSATEEILALVDDSCVLQTVHVAFQMSHPAQPEEAANHRKQNVALCKLRMQVVKEGKQRGKTAKEVEMDFGMRAVELIKGWLA